jgi:hypothetical protein
MIWQRDHMVRRIYLTDHYSESVTPSWFGESIGHYETEGTLVIDTIGLSTKNSFIDNFRTPHSEKEHVIERYKVSDDGRMLEAAVTVDRIAQYAGARRRAHRRAGGRWFLVSPDG